MLTSAEALVEFDDASGRVIPDRLTRRRHAAYAGYAQRMLAIYAAGIGQTRRELHQQVERLLAAAEDCPRRRIAAFQKLLDEAAHYDTAAARQAAKLRQRVFARAATFHPLVTRREGLHDHCEQEIKRAIATELGLSWEQIDAALFSDVIEFQRLRAFDGYASAQALLARYNVAQTQAALYRAEQMWVWANNDYKMVLRYAKLAGLMHTIRREADGGYCFRFNGPAAALRRSTRYGVAMARLLPGLLACRNWRALAQVQNRFGKRYRLELTSQDGLHSPVSAAKEFDSQWEADFMAAWAEADSGGWRLERETDILHRGQAVFTPDFTLVAQDGRRVLLEIVGYWTPEYLEHKTRQLQHFGDQEILLAIPAQSRFEVPAGLAPPIVFKDRLQPSAVLARLSGRVQGSGSACTTDCPS